MFIKASAIWGELTICNRNVFDVWQVCMQYTQTMNGSSMVQPHFHTLEFFMDALIKSNTNASRIEMRLLGDGERGKIISPRLELKLRAVSKAFKNAVVVPCHSSLAAVAETNPVTIAPPTTVFTTQYLSSSRRPDELTVAIDWDSAAKDPDGRVLVMMVTQGRIFVDSVMQCLSTLKVRCEVWNLERTEYKQRVRDSSQRIMLKLKRSELDVPAMIINANRDKWKDKILIQTQEEVGNWVNKHEGGSYWRRLQ